MRSSISEFMFIADTLSRTYPSRVDDARLVQWTKFENNLENFCTVKDLAVAQPQLKRLQEVTITDVTLQRVINLVSGGWPETKRHIPADKHVYFCHRDELVVGEGLLLRGNRV